MIGFEKQTNDLGELKLVTDAVTKKASSKTNNFSKSDEELILNILLGLSAFWDSSEFKIPHVRKIKLERQGKDSFEM